jgi:MFS transporter, ACS family, solute carrier family 17 (sodium-dependent inorganic phosphate cotransporter), other
MGEAVAPSSTTDMIARTIATEERSRAIAFSFGGLHVGSLLGLLLAPFMIEHLGWPSVSSAGIDKFPLLPSVKCSF